MKVLAATGIEREYIPGASDKVKKTLNRDVAAQSLLQLLHHNKLHNPTDLATITVSKVNKRRLVFT